MSDDPLETVSHRLHPSSLVLCLIEDLRKWVLPLVLVLFLGSGDRWELWLMVFIAPSMAYEVLRYITMRYRIAGGELIVRQGLLQKSERHIPFGRIQNVDLVQGVLQRLLGVAEVRIETASGTEAEAVLRFLSLADVDAMRARVFAGREARKLPEEGSDPHAVPLGEAFEELAEVEPTRTVLALGLPDLVQLGLVVNRGVALIAAGIGLAWEFDLSERVSTDWFEAWHDSLDSTGTTLFWMAAVLVVILLSLFLSVIATVIRLHGFRLVRQGDEFRLSCGLLTKHRATIPQRRIQLISVHESLLQRLMGVASVRIETAGGSEGEVASLARRWFLPLVPRAHLSTMLARVNPDLNFNAIEWQPLAPGARTRAFKAASIVGLLIGASCTAIEFPRGGLVLLALVPFLLLVAHLDWRFKRWARPSGAVAFREGAFRHRTSITFDSRVHAVRVGESPFDRRWGMASLSVDTAGAGVAQHKIRVPYLKRELAMDLQGELATQAEAIGFRW